MITGYDAKRMFCNRRGLGNYSRDLIRILSEYYPENTYHLYTPVVKIDVRTDERNTSVFQPEGIFSVLPKWLWRAQGVKKQIVINGDDIFHGLSQELPAGLEKTSVKKVVTFHDALFLRFPELYDTVYRKIITLKTHNALKVADRIIAISEQSKQDAMYYFGAREDKIEVIYQGCNNIFRKNVSEQQKENVKTKYALPSQYLLYVGAIEKRKNISGLLNALQKVKTNIPLVIAGHNTRYADEMKTLAGKLNPDRRVVFLHNAENYDLPAIYQMAEIFLFPSLFEGFGIPILEALCSGTPVIASAGSCFEETGGKHSIYVDTQNSEVFAHAIDNLLVSHELQKVMKTEGLKHAENFTDEKIARQLNNLYKNLF